MDKRPISNLKLTPVSPGVAGPLYRQIVESIKREIRDGRLGSGDPLPPYRLLAEQMLVSIITAKRAYEELERDGCIYRKRGIGTFELDPGNWTVS